MNTANKTSRVLGFAFLLQFVTSLLSGTILRQLWFVPGDMSSSMLNIARQAMLMRANILVDVLTALGIVFLGAMLFLTLRHQNEKIALVALGCYLVEALLLAASRIETFSLLRISQAYAASGQPANLLALGNLAYESMDFGGNVLHMLAFCVGGILFYYLLYKSSLVPKLLSLWGLIAVIPCLIGTLFVVFGFQVPFFIYLPYAPFEFVIGIWILVKGVQDEAVIQQPIMLGYAG